MYKKIFNDFPRLKLNYLIQENLANKNNYYIDEKDIIYLPII